MFGDILENFMKFYQYSFILVQKLFNFFFKNCTSCFFKEEMFILWFYVKID